MVQLDGLLQRVAYDLDFVPNKSDSNFKKWKDSGLVEYSDFYKGVTLKSFEELKQQGLTNHDLLDFYNWDTT